ncbi:MAG: hypothetical protein KDK91_18740 [Gammaproteobacteria bacterium]|nr:hypothetical protein [Gammaproteobacteria bacterium]
MSKRTRSFRITLLKIFTLLTLLTTTGVGFIFYYRATDVILDQSDKLVQEVTAKIIERSERYLTVPARQAQAISHFVSEPDITRIRDKLWEYSWEQLLVLPQVQSIFIADTAGSYVQVRREPRYATRIIDRAGSAQTETWLYRDPSYAIVGRMDREPSFDPRTRPWFRNTRPEPRIYWTDVYVFTTSQTPGISSSYPVIADDGGLMAVVCVNTPLHSISALLAEQRISEHGVVFITNEKGELIAFPQHEKTTRIDPKTGKRTLSLVSEMQERWLANAYESYRQRVDRSSRELDAQSRRSWYQRLTDALGAGYLPSLQEVFHYAKREFHVSRYDDRNYLTYVAPFPKSFPSNWQMVVVLPESDLMGPLDQMRHYALLGAALFLLLSLGVVYVLSTSITRPINRLAEQMKRIQSLELDAVERVPSYIKEVDQMSEALVTASNGLQSFRKYVPAKLVRELMQMGIEAKPGGEEVELTAMFTDIAGFTSITESMEPQALMAQLSEYLAEMSDIVIDEQGTIDKYIGDAVMAFWGAPNRLDDAVYLACRAALRCQTRIAGLNAVWASQGKPQFQTRIGLHTDRMIVGNLGSEDRLNYTIMGHGVNLAARLEGTNKLYGTGIIVSEATRERVKDRFRFRLLDAVAVKGQTRSYRIYELLAERDQEISFDQQRLATRYEQALDLYFKGRWVAAFVAFNQLAADYPNDLATQVMLERCRTFRDAPEQAPENWDGSIALQEK